MQGAGWVRSKVRLWSAHPCEAHCRVQGAGRRAQRVQGAEGAEGAGCRVQRVQGAKGAGCRGCRVQRVQGGRTVR